MLRDAVVIKCITYLKFLIKLIIEVMGFNMWISIAGKRILLRPSHYCTWGRRKQVSGHENKLNLGCPSHCTWKLRKQVKMGGVTYSRLFFKFILNKVVFLVWRAMVTNHGLEFVWLIWSSDFCLPIRMITV